MKMANSKQIFDLFPGIWRIARETFTKKQWKNSGAECIKATGFAAFTPDESDSNLLLYSEKVIVNCGNDSNSRMNGMEAKQKYKYRFDNTTSSLIKYFFDDRLFYTLKIENRQENESAATVSSSEITGCGEHLCIQDVYKATYSFHSDEYFELNYSINGPKKDYTIFNTYVKCKPHEVTELGLRVVNGELL